MRAAGSNPTCADCNADLVDWESVWDRDPSKIDKTFQNLKHEYIRHYYWHRAFDEKAINYARRKGKIALMAAIEPRLQSCISKPADSFDGRRTNWEGNPIHYAQHATATCCRRCIEKWYDIPRDQELNKDEMEYFTGLVTRYIDERLTDLSPDPEKVPAKRSK